MVNLIPIGGIKLFGLGLIYWLVRIAEEAMDSSIDDLFAFEDEEE